MCVLIGSPQKSQSKKGIDEGPSSPNKYSEEKLQALATAFAMSDISTGRSGKIKATEVPNTMRMLGQCPTGLQVNKAIVDVEILRRSKIEARLKAELKEKEATKKKGRKRGKDKKQLGMVRKHSGQYRTICY